MGDNPSAAGRKLEAEQISRLSEANAIDGAARSARSSSSRGSDPVSGACISLLIEARTSSLEKVRKILADRTDAAESASSPKAY